MFETSLLHFAAMHGRVGPIAALVDAVPSLLSRSLSPSERERCVQVVHDEFIECRTPDSITSGYVDVVVSLNEVS